MKQNIDFFNFNLNRYQLKMFAVVTMFIDHIGAFLLDYNNVFYPLCRSVGRLAFPIFCLMIAEGAIHTRSITRYLGRLALYAIISNPPYNLVNGGQWYSLENKNVFFTLFIGLLAIAIIQKGAPWIFCKLGKFVLAENERACIILSLPFIIALYALAYEWNTDYGGYGVAAIVIFYILRNRKTSAWLCFALLTFVSYNIILVGSFDTIPMNLYSIFVHQPWNNEYTVELVNSRQMLAVLSLVPVHLYNGEKGQSKNKYFFYAFYPLHLVLLWMIQLLIK